METKNLEALIDQKDPAWPEVLKWISEADYHVEVLPPPGEEARKAALLAMQVTTHSSMGAVVYESGGILIEHGWIRILGSGHAKLQRTLPGWNQQIWGALTELPYMLIADDAVGGFFAMDGGEFGEPGNIFYFAPDSLRWQPLHMGYSAFLSFCFNGKQEEFYGPLRWPGWQTEVQTLTGDQGFSVYPPPFATTPHEGTNNPDHWMPMEERKREAVPIRELYSFYVEDMAKQLAEMDDEATAQ